MPWTRRQVRYLLSSGSPLDEGEKAKMKRELHENPEMGHKEKGKDVTSSTYDWRKRRK